MEKLPQIFTTNSGTWWWTGRPGVLQSMGSQRVRRDWVTELNWINSGIRIWISTHMNPWFLHLYHVFFSEVPLSCLLFFFFFAHSSKLHLKFVCLQPREGTAKGAFLLPVPGRAVSLVLKSVGSFFFLILSFFFFKLWKYDLENTEQSYV